MPALNECTIAFLGAGNMGRALMGGLLRTGFPAARLQAADPDPAQLARLPDGVRAAASNAEAVSGADLVVVAVKPQVMAGVVRDLAASWQDTKPLLLSIAAGIRSGDIARWSGGCSVVRAMPNTPALLGCGVSALYAAATVDATLRDMAAAVLGAVGTVLWVEEEGLLDAVTAVSGSGPAYFFLLMEALAAAGAELGLPSDQAEALSVQTALGAARMAAEAGSAPGVLRTQVTSRGGTTERAIGMFEEGGFRDLVQRAVRAAAERSAEMSRSFGEG